MHRRWMQWAGLFLALLAAAAVARAAGPTSLTVVPVSTATIGKAIPIEVDLEGVPDDEPTVTLFFRNRSASTFLHATLKPAGKGAFKGEIPATSTSGLAVRYYVQVSGPGDSYRTAFGSATSPLSIDLLDPPARATGNPLFLAGIACLIVAAAGSGLWWSERLRRNRALDRAFWLRTLAPLYGLPGPKLAQEVRRLCGMPLEHPVKGLTIFPRETIMGMLYEAGHWNEAEVKRDVERFASDVRLPAAASGAGRAPGADDRHDLSGNSATGAGARSMVSLHAVASPGASALHRVPK